MNAIRRLFTLLTLCLGCAPTPSTRDVRVTILDDAGEPLPGAVLYVEAYDASGPFAFLTAKAGGAGVVPDQARSPLEIAWRPGARLALAAFHPGYRPAVVRDPSRRITSDGALLTLSPGSEAEPRITELAFPFEDRPGLAGKLAGREYADLRDAFRRSYAALPPAVAERELSRLDAVESANPLE